MTSSTDLRPPPASPTGSPPERARSHQHTSRSVSAVAGLAILALTPLAVFANFIVVEGLITPGDAVATAADVMASEGMFRLGIAAWYLVVVLDVVAAWALTRVCTGVDAGLSRLAGWLRLAYSGVLMIAGTELVGGLRLLEGGPHLGAFGAEQLQANALLRFTAFNDLFDAALILFAFHLAVLGYLAFRSGYVPKLVGVLLGVAGAGYLIDSMTAVLGQPTNVGAFTFMGEFLLAVWLVVRARAVSAGAASRDELVAVAR